MELSGRIVVVVVVVVVGSRGEWSGEWGQVGSEVKSGQVKSGQAQVKSSGE